MTPEKERCCENCYYYSALANFCLRRLETHKPNSKPCEMWKDWEDFYGEDD